MTVRGRQEERSAEQKLLLHSMGIVFDEMGETPSHAEFRELRFDIPFRRAATFPIKSSEDPDVFAAGKKFWQFVVAREIYCPSARRFAAMVAAIDENGPFLTLHKVEDQPDERRFTRAIRPDEPDDLPWLHTEADGGQSCRLCRGIGETDILDIKGEAVNGEAVIPGHAESC